MKNKKSVFFILFVLVCVVFTTCHNAIMDKWWPEDKPKTGKTQSGPDGGNEGSGENFGVVRFDLGFTPGAGEGPQPLNIKVAWGKAVGRLRPIVRKGYGLEGWIDKFDNPWPIETKTIPASLAAAIAADLLDSEGFITLRAVWSDDTSTVTFITTGPPGFVPPVVPAQTVANGGLVTQPLVPTPPPGYGFAGWYDDEDCNDPGFVGTPWNFSNNKITGDKKLFARWEQNFCVVDFNSNGGTRPDGVTKLTHTQTVAQGSLVQDPGPLIREGYTFNGWYDNPGLTGTPWNFEVNTAPLEPALTLHAKWDLNIYNINFEPFTNANVPTMSDQAKLTPLKPALQKVPHGDRITQPAFNPPRLEDGRDFSGWYTNEGLTIPWDFNDPVTGNLTLYAKYEYKFRTVIFSVNGGNDWPESQTIKEIAVGQKIINPGPPSRGYGFAFIGWFPDPAYKAGTGFDFTRYTIPVPDVPPGTEVDPIYLYAGWRPTLHSIPFSVEKFNDEITYGYISFTEAYHGERISRPIVTAEEGFSLDGWYRNSNFTDPWDFDNDVAENSITLYARWKVTNYIIKFNLGDPTDDPTWTWGLNSSVHNKAFEDSLNNQHYLYYDEVKDEFYVIEPSVPALPASDTSSSSFLRWDYYPIGKSDSDRGNLEPWDFDNYDVESHLAPGVNYLNLYARWVRPVPDMVWVPRGSFTMGESNVSGSPAALHSYPTRKVTLDGFYIGRYQVTQDEYKFVGSPSHYTGDTLPVDSVSWFDAIEYCNRKSSTDGLTSVYTITGRIPAGTGHPITGGTVTVINWKNNGYRLPTEAEWEYAAKGGNGMGPYLPYSGHDDPAQVAWYNITSGNKGTKPVGTTPKANTLGIWDMSGNISEWCWDWCGSYDYDAYFNTPAASLNPSGPSGGVTSGTTRLLTPPDQRVRRGGCWSNGVGNIRSVVRNSEKPDAANWVIGFRVARSPDLNNIY